MKTNPRDNWGDSHRRAMADILLVLASSSLGAQLGFKGGTALYFFYGLDRFSVDLDFDWITSSGGPDDFRSGARAILAKHFPTWKITDAGNVQKSARLLIDYGGGRKLKLEVSWPICSNRYHDRPLFGTPVTVMVPECMYANKLAAMYARFLAQDALANRDLWDVRFFSQMGVRPDESVVRCCTARFPCGEMGVGDFCAFLHTFLLKNRKRFESRVTDGLGDLLSGQSERDRAKVTLYPEVLAVLEKEAFLGRTPSSS